MAIKDYDCELGIRYVLSRLHDGIGFKEDGEKKFQLVLDLRRLSTDMRQG